MVRDPREYSVNRPPIWCPGCGDYAILEAVKRALAELDIPNERVVVVSGIGCSAQLPHFLKVYGIHSIHGRALPVATGVKLANPSLTVIAVGGDGDGYGIGGNHLLHAARRNIDITYIVSNNQVYGLTTGQAAPTTLRGVKTKSTPYGALDYPLNPIMVALAAGATFVARGFSGDVRHLTWLVKEAIRHRGFAIIDVLSPCVTFNRVNTYDWFRARVYRLEDVGHDPTNFEEAVKRAMEWPTGSPDGKIPIGIFYRVERETFDEAVKKVTGVSPIESPIDEALRRRDELISMFKYEL